MKILIAAITIALCVSVPPTHADEVSRKVITENLLQTMKVDRMMEPIFEQMRSMMEQQFAQMDTTEDMKPILKRYIDRLVELMEQTLSWRILREDMITIYTNVFTEDELKGMLAFYKSPVGQSVITKMPSATQESIKLMQKRMPELQQKIKRIAKEMTEEIETEKAKQKKK